MYRIEVVKDLQLEYLRKEGSFNHKVCGVVFIDRNEIRSLQTIYVYPKGRGEEGTTVTLVDGKEYDIHMSMQKMLTLLKDGSKTSWDLLQENAL